MDFDVDLLEGILVPVATGVSAYTSAKASSYVAAAFLAIIAIDYAVAVFKDENPVFQEVVDKGVEKTQKLVTEYFSPEYAEKINLAVSIVGGLVSLGPLLMSIGNIVKNSYELLKNGDISSTVDQIKQFIAQYKTQVSQKIDQYMKKDSTLTSTLTFPMVAKHSSKNPVDEFRAMVRNIDVPYSLAQNDKSNGIKHSSFHSIKVT